MREILFRAWDGKKMLPVAMMQFQPFFSATVDLTPFHKQTGGLEIMQYTGLKDKNGVEIYEGDTVRFYFDELNGWKEFRVSWKGFGFGLEGVYTLGDLLRHPETVEVIGNIYENKGLL